MTTPQPLTARDDTRSKILDLAELLWLGRGFNGFSYQHISRELGVKNAAIHYHFPHKVDLGVELVRRYRRRLARYIEASAKLDARAQLERFFALSDAYFLNEQQICPSGSLSAEFHTLPDELKAEAALFVGDMRAWALAIVRQGREEGSLIAIGRDEETADILYAGLQGALQLARMAPDLLEHVKSALRVQLGITPGV
ncbi:TetR/AcrR family transcriptional regulator [Crenobacter cavernae]|uniref:TetR/AcrR family transcriptional regulator n=1 Tax=Crenobacter cavernae TaxID=2290923 RepID=A0ABY0FAR1_9NEIS|nr:TetR/AcrR family transcriptional regulator [Crenobacter cavernae]RXZ42739.1 TetR/AcrR family transcriptional regulator [Crenobacter cavernae]